MRITIEHDVPVRMRDGVVLRANVFLPEGAAQLPTIVQRNPYNKDAPQPGAPLDAMRFVRAGYAFVLQDVRGRFGSGGVFTPFANEMADGDDTIAWAASQSWSNGQVAMVGGSYNGATQLLAAAATPEALVTIAPRMTSSDYHDGWTYRNGAFELGFVLFWTLHSLVLADLEYRASSGANLHREIDEVISAIDALEDHTYRGLTLRQVELLANFAPYYQDWLDHPSADNYWRAVSPRERYDRIDVPALHVGGWYDIFLEGTIENFQGLRRSARSERTRSGQRLVIGPWTHGVLGGIFRERNFGTLSSFDTVDVTGLHLRWYDRWLRGIGDNGDHDPQVKIFVMGDNRWRDEADWPLPGTIFRRFYLDGGGFANTASGDGRLTTAAPTAHDGAPDRFLYDPRRPVPTMGGGTLLAGQSVGMNSGPRDLRPLAAREDILHYFTEPLNERLEVTGPLELRIFVSSSAPDTDFTARLIDIHPAGYAALLAEGVLRMRFRESLSHPQLLQAGRVYEVRIGLGATSNAFLPGHRICLAISSSNFPRYDLNNNMGDDSGRVSTTGSQVAINSVYHDALHPSHLVLPIVVRD